MESPLNGANNDGVRSALIFLGTGCSNSVPSALCLIQPSDPPCHVCSMALSIPPEQNPNYRCNTSLLIDYCRSDEKHSYILIDVGKTFREQVLRWFTFHKIPRVDSIILTHEHADAVLGLDDIRAVQRFSPKNDIDATPVFLSQTAMDSIALKFPYLIKKKLREGQEIRRVAQLDWKIIAEDWQSPFVASGLQFFPLPVTAFKLSSNTHAQKDTIINILVSYICFLVQVMHGEDYICLGFLFGEKSQVAYISDVSRFPAGTEYVISKSGAGQLDLLILDSLRRNGSHNVHFCLPQALEAVKRLCPKQALLIGMNHEFDHYKDNDFLAEWSEREGIPVQLAHDGLRVPMDL
ncbi:putative hydrolase C777.06c isoform X1 [Hevea brasiliensis]|uniref:putative hydrolase C777.06c isoform X1 n=1 Tax=Hevea brasiliensis TaxID=3981 RepID=UPI0025F03469|nr:putative hydrolase C777.06c isoform X1 [Hevea brasiliensis]